MKRLVWLGIGLVAGAAGTAVVGAKALRRQIGSDPTAMRRAAASVGAGLLDAFADRVRPPRRRTAVSRSSATG
jgi:hypothetical protein